MAITKIHRVTTTLSTALDYIENPDKTDDQLLVTGYACTPETASLQFNQVKRNSDKKDGTLAFHLIQSFSPGEVDFKTAHEIGIALADKVLGGRFQYVVATHIDKGHYHNHIIFNSVSFKDYKKYHSTAQTYRYIKRCSDVLCNQYGLSVIREPKERGKTHYERTLEKKGQSWKSLLRQTIDKAILMAKDWDEFLLIMQREKYEIKTGKYISFRAEGQERFTRSKTLGTDYTEENIRSRILGGGRQISDEKPEMRHNLIIDIQNSIKAQQSRGYANWAKGFNLKVAADTLNYLTEHNLLDLDVMDRKIAELSEKYDSSREQLKDMDKRIKLIDEQIHEIEVYRKTKPVVDGLDKVVFKERYKKQHESDFILFNASEKAIKKWFGSGKPPLIKSLRAEQNSLKEQRAKLKSAMENDKPELDELRKMRRNIDVFLGREDEQERASQKKRSGELE